jgi:peptidoglycan/LPS O-acetylase OafA/YrhL
LSFSFYLWHWPLLVIPAQMQGAAMPLPANLLLLAVALVLSVLTYRFVENPVRRSRFLARRPRTSIAIGLGLVAGSILFAASAIVRHRIL